MSWWYSGLVFTLLSILSLQRYSWSSSSVHLSCRPAEAAETEAAGVSAEPPAESRGDPEEGVSGLSWAQTRVVVVVILTGPGWADIPESSF